MSPPASMFGVVNPWKIVREKPELTVIFDDLPDGLLGYCDHHTQTIYLTRGMRQRQRRAVLHHELTHMKYPTATECLVEQLAANALIPIDVLVDALMWSQDEQQLAEELWVDVATVRDRLAGLSEVERRFIDAEMDRREMTYP